jgi:hypothetical protein
VISVDVRVGLAIAHLVKLLFTGVQEFGKFALPSYILLAKFLQLVFFLFLISMIVRFFRFFLLRLKSVNFLHKKLIFSLDFSFSLSHDFLVLVGGLVHFGVQFMVKFNHSVCQFSFGLGFHAQGTLLFFFLKLEKFHLLLDFLFSFTFYLRKFLAFFFLKFIN